jgi:hypothetical protein
MARKINSGCITAKENGKNITTPKKIRRPRVKPGVD